MPRLSKYLIRLKQFLCCVTILLYLFMGKAYALGLGKLEVQSNLDESLKLKIELLATSGEKLNEIEAVIASREDFSKIGAYYPEYLKTVGIKIISDDGDPYLLMTSKQIIKEPFIHFLIRVNWSGGSLLREYTALIDPPVYAAEAPQPVVTPKVVESKQRPAPSPAPSEDSYQPSTEDRADDVSDFQDQAPEPSYDSDTSNLDDVDAAYGPVEPGETLSEIAVGLQQQFPELSMYQIMYVLFEENREAFIDDNINGLLKGAVLKISSINKIRDTQMRDATGLFTEHVARWQAKTGYIAAEQQQELKVSQDEETVLFDDDAVSQAEEQAVEETEDEIQFEETVVEEPVSQEPEETDSFVIGSSEDDQPGSSGVSNEGEVLALQSELSELQASLESSKLEKSELQERVSILEAQLEEVNRLMAMEVEDAELASLQNSQNIAESEVPVDEVPEGEEMIEVADEMQEVTDQVAVEDTEQLEEVVDEELEEVADEIASEELQEVTDDEIETIPEEQIVQEQQGAESKVTPVTPEPEPQIQDVSKTPADFAQPEGFLDKDNV